MGPFRKPPPREDTQQEGAQRLRDKYQEGSLPCCMGLGRERLLAALSWFQVAFTYPRENLSPQFVQRLAEEIQQENGTSVIRKAAVALPHFLETSEPISMQYIGREDLGSNQPDLES